MDPIHVKRQTVKHKQVCSTPHTSSALARENAEHSAGSSSHRHKWGRVRLRARSLRLGARPKQLKSKKGGKKRSLGGTIGLRSTPRPKKGGTHPPNLERTHLYDRHPPRDVGRSICQCETSRLPLLGNMRARRPKKTNKRQPQQATRGNNRHTNTR